MSEDGKDPYRDGSGVMEVQTRRRDVGPRGDGRDELGHFMPGNRIVPAERPSAGVGRDPRGRTGVRRYCTPAHQSHKSRRLRRLRSAAAFTYAHLAPPAPQRGRSTRVAPSQTSQIRPRPSAAESPLLARETGKDAQGWLADILVDGVESGDVGL